MYYKWNFIQILDVIKKGAFGGTYFRDIYSNVTGKFYKSSWKEFEELIILIIWFQWYFRYWKGRRSEDDKSSRLLVDLLVF